jgi:hypothetical protein
MSSIGHFGVIHIDAADSAGDDKNVASGGVQLNISAAQKPTSASPGISLL